MEQIDIISRIKYWTTINNIEFTENEYLWWSLSTGYLSILEKFLSIVQSEKSEFLCLGSLSGSLAGNERTNNYFIDGLPKNRSFSSSTIKQYISIGIIFGIIEISENKFLDNKNKFFLEWTKGNIKLKISPKFIECQNSNFYLINKKNYIINVWQKLSKLGNNFIRKDLNKIIFNIFIFNSQISEYQPEKFISLVNERQIKNKSKPIDTKRVEKEFELNKKLWNFFMEMVDIKNEE